MITFSFPLSVLIVIGLSVLVLNSHANLVEKPYLESEATWRRGNLVGVVWSFHRWQVHSTTIPGRMNEGASMVTIYNDQWYYIFARGGKLCSKGFLEQDVACGQELCNRILKTRTPEVLMPRCKKL